MSNLPTADDQIQVDLSPEHITQVLGRAERGEVLTGQERRELRVFLENKDVAGNIAQVGEDGTGRIQRVLGSNTAGKVALTRGDAREAPPDIAPLKELVKRRKLSFVSGNSSPARQDNLVFRQFVSIYSHEGTGRGEVGTQMGTIRIDVDTGEILEDTVTDAELRPLADYLTKAMQFHGTSYPVYPKLDAHVAQQDVYNLGELYQAADEWQQAEAGPQAEPVQEDILPQ